MVFEFRDAYSGRLLAGDCFTMFNARQRSMGNIVGIPEERLPSYMCNYGQTPPADLFPNTLPLARMVEDKNRESYDVSKALDDTFAESVKNMKNRYLSPAFNGTLYQNEELYKRGLI